MGEFLTKTLGELTSIMTKGIAPKYTEKTGDNTVMVLNQKCNRDFLISLEQSRRNDCSKKAVSPERLLRKYDVLINSTGTGTAGRVAQLFDVPTSMTIDGHMILIRPTDEIDPIYYGYAVKMHQDEIQLLAEGSTGQTEINRRRLETEILISYPRDLASQKQIGKFLYQIDQKIWNNTAINDNLEEQVALIYKSWFEDFEMSSYDCPKSWHHGTLSDIANISSGKRPPMKSSLLKPDVCIPLVGAASVMGFTNTANHTDRILVIGRVGTHGVIQRFNTSCWTSDNTLVITSNYYEFTNQILQRIDYSSMNRGSTQPLITQGDLNKVVVLIPDNNMLVEFESIAGVLMAQYEANVIENKELLNLRDTLLPRLMSGELDVSEIDI